ncbi:MAG: glycoside hydrolase family 3 protein [Candidatus Coproplasma sp.]
MINLKATPFYLTDEQEKWVYEQLNNLTTEQKAGQLFCLLGTIYDTKELKQLVEDYCIGGVLFRPEPTEVIKEKYAQIDSGAVPLLRAANLEEGGVGGVSDGTWFGSQMQVAATDDLNCCKDFAKVCAEEGGAVGVNWTFSPVCDIDYNFRNPITNVRTFGSDPDRVERFALEYVKTIQGEGVAACAKHFPGDGYDFRDQHLHPTINGLSADEWHATYGRIYRTLIDNGLLSIMVGHIKQPAVEMSIDKSLTYKDCMPASLSKALLTGVLREKYGFNGVITTDATIMGGYTMAMERRRAIPYTIAAGCDMIVFSTDFYEDYSFMLEGIKSGIVTEQRLNDAVTRILALKAKVCRVDTPEKVENKAEKVRTCADKAVTLVKNIGDILPVTPDRYKSIRLITLGSDDLEGESLTQTARTILERERFSVEIYSREKDDMHGVKELSADRLTLYLANEPTESNRVTVRLSWNPKHAMDIPRYIHEEPSVFLSLYNPYHLQDIPAVKVFVNAYTPTKVNLCAALSKIFGRSEFKGVSPVDAFCGLEDTKY